jgi:nitrite reductase/ring-hydroxylating ferredoxin subunit
MMLKPKPQLSEAEFQAITQQFDALVQEFENLPFPQIREMVFDLLGATDALHREGLGRLLAFLHDQGQAGLVEQAAEADFMVRTLLLLYDFIPTEDQPPKERLKSGLTFIPLDRLLQDLEKHSHRPVFKEVARLEELPLGMMKGVEIEGVYILLANVAGEIYAVRGQCPGSMAPLYLGVFTPPVVVCPWHNEAYDVRTGKRVDVEEAPALDILPVTVVEGVIQVALDDGSNNKSTSTRL